MKIPPTLDRLDHGVGANLVFAHREERRSQGSPLRSEYRIMRILPLLGRLAHRVEANQGASSNGKNQGTMTTNMINTTMVKGVPTRTKSIDR